MTMSDVISTGALLAMGVIALVLLIQYLKLHDFGQMIHDCKTATRWARISNACHRIIRCMAGSLIRQLKWNIRERKRFGIATPSKKKRIVHGLLTVYDTKS